MKMHLKFLHNLKICKFILKILRLNQLKLNYILHRNLGNNIFPTLPTEGLNKVTHLKTFNNPRLKEFPAPDKFPRIQTLVLSYAYHCCAFIPLIPATVTRKPPLHESVLFPSDTEFDMSLWNSSVSDIWPILSKHINL